ncbi:hypothetical protein TIFTF001_030769 [Ficus carica]|uniref:Uncharacterized protein n=1 Tax=Ficus carica TaxID=3494 RepID=A0AA88J4K7_FICCA|nr:hypothetical protein TIFTF001_030769 [Ficus carica]
MGTEKDKIEHTEQELLEGAVQDYKKLRDKSAMMKCVKAFKSRHSMCNFLKREGCLEELIQLESEWGNFMDAAKIAKEIGEVLLKAELLEKGKNHKDSSLVFLFYVLANSLWEVESKGWPLMEFTRIKELLNKAKTMADNVSTHFFKFV